MPSFLSWNETVSKGFEYLPNSTTQQTVSVGTKLFLVLAIILLLIALIWLAYLWTKQSRTGESR